MTVLDHKGLFIGGRWLDSADGSRTPVVNPATGETLCTVADGTPTDGRAAVAAAVAAQRNWARTSPRNRSEILYRAYEAILADIEQFAELITLEMGKPLAEARGEVRYAAEFFRWFAEEAVRVNGHFGH